jgi:hypothetical protein
MELQLRVRMTLAELPKRFWNHAMPGYALNESHPQYSGLAAS